MQSLTQRNFTSALNQHRQGNLKEAERLYLEVLKDEINHPDANHNLGAIYVSKNQIEQSLPLFKRATEVSPKIEQFWTSYVEALMLIGQTRAAQEVLVSAEQTGIEEKTLEFLRARIGDQWVDQEAIQSLANLMLAHNQNGKHQEAKELSKDFIKKYPEQKIGWSIMAASLRELNQKKEAVDFTKKLINKFPEETEARVNLGALLFEIGELKEAETVLKQAIAFDSNHTATYNNLGIVLHALGKPEEAATYLRQAVSLESANPEYCNNLGRVLLDLADPKEAYEFIDKAIEIKNDFAEAHFNLGALHHIAGDLSSATKSMERACELAPTKKRNRLFLEFFKGQAKHAKLINAASREQKHANGEISNYDPVLINRPVEKELVEKLYRSNSIKLDDFKDVQSVDARYGNGVCSPDFNLFESDDPIISSASSDLVAIMKDSVGSDIFIVDSFFNIQGPESGIVRHNHISEFDQIGKFSLKEHKFSLVYYLTVGDQNCEMPGTLKFYNPEKEILPTKGMILIFPAERYHSIAYNGATDRIVIAVNFYSIKPLKRTY